MLGKKLVAVVLLAIGLAGCGSMSKLETSYNIHDDVAALPNGGAKAMRVESSSVEVTSPDGQTANLNYVKWIDPNTGKVINDATYAYNGKNTERTTIDNVTGSIIPAGEAAAGWAGAALLTKPLQITNKGATAISKSGAVAGAKLTVH